MQVLPLRDEVRIARERATYAEKALHLSNTLGIALSAVAIVERQLREIDAPEVELPGDQVVEQAIGAYPELAGLSGIAPDPTAPPLRQLQQRRMQLQTIDQFIRPIAATHNELSMNVHELQHQQIRLLQQPEYSELREQLDAKSEVRRKGSLTVSRLKMRRQSLLPAQRSVEVFVPVAEKELADTSDPLNAQRARERLLTIVQTLDVASRSTGLEVPMPDVAALYDPSCPVELLHETVQALHVLHAAAVAEAEILDAEIARLEAEIEEATAWMLARTG